MCFVCKAAIPQTANNERLEKERKEKEALVWIGPGLSAPSSVFYNTAAEPESLLLHLFLSCLRRQGERLGKVAQARKQKKGAGESK